jgi:lysophospholipase L1-like esterase
LTRHSYTSTRLHSDFDRIISRATAPHAAPTLLFTIFLGANDACFIGAEEYVPWPKFSANIRYFIETILNQDALPDTKIILITPPPINGPAPKIEEGMTEEDIEEANGWKRKGPRYKTYMSKKRYAEGIMRIAEEYEKTGRVVGVDFWRGLVDAKATGDGSGEDVKKGIEELGLWPGCGLLGAGSFDKGWFTDGLHLDRKGYAVLSKMVMEAIEGKWPELAPERL